MNDSLCHILQSLYATLLERKGAPASASYTAQLFAGGPAKIAKKLGEEAIETGHAAMQGKSADIVSESADLLFHLLVLWADAGVLPQEVWAELKRREGVSGLAEKAARKNDDR